MPIIGIEHVQLAMPAGEEEKARSFYRDVLGLTEVPKPAGLMARGGAWFEHGSVKLHLGVQDDFRPARKAHVALVVTGLQDLIERARAATCEIAFDEPLKGFDRVFVYDPFGNRLELMERVS